MSCFRNRVCGSGLSPDIDRAPLGGARKRFPYRRRMFRERFGKDKDVASACALRAA